MTARNCYIIRVSPEGRGDIECGPDGPFSPDEALKRAHREPDPLSGWRDIIVSEIASQGRAGLGDPVIEAMREEVAAREQERLAHVSRCPQCGRSANGAEWDLLSHAQAMNAALRHVRWLAEVAADSGIVPAQRILEALDRPYRFPLPDGGKVAAIHMRIVQGNDLIADLPEWPGPVPREGDYIFHPPSRPGGHEAIAGSVACVKWRTHDRTEGGGAFVMTAHPYVEVVLRS